MAEAGGVSFDLSLTTRMTMKAKSAGSVFYNYHSPEERFRREPLLYNTRYKAASEGRLLMVRHRGSSLLFTLIALGVAISSRPAHGQTISFLRSLNGVDPQASTPGVGGVVATDASGIYVALDNGVLAKFDSHGNVLWTRVTGAYGLFGPAADGAGVYVSGRMYNEPNPVTYFLRRYDADGNELWTRQTEAWFNPAADASGVYVAAAMIGATTTTLYVRKYDSSGIEQWTRPFVTPKLGVAVGISVAVGATGLYVVGGDDSSTTLGKFDASGNQLWSRQLPRFVGPPMTVDDTGVYFINNGSDSFLRKYDTSGNALWTRSVGAIPRALAADATGIYVVGLTGSSFLPGQCRTGLFSDAFAQKYDHDGTVLWTRESFSASYSSSSQANYVAMNDTGVYVVGGGGFDAPNTGEAFLARLEKTAAVVTDSRPRISPGCPVNAASYLGGGVAPGEIVTIFGAAMGPPDLVPLSLTADGRLDTTLAGARILFNGAPAPLLYVSDKQSSAIVPYAVAGQSAVDVQVEYQGVQSDVVTLPVLPSRPGIFSLDGSGQGLLAIQNEDGSVNSPSNPAARGSIVSIYATGGGERDPAVADGQILSDVLPRISLPIELAFDNGSCDNEAYGEILYAGGSPGSVAGLLQINVRVPPDALAGNAVGFWLVIGHDGVLGSPTIALR
jgi:uncharacterized protein (TIGR03437 family)